MKLVKAFDGCTVRRNRTFITRFAALTGKCRFDATKVSSVNLTKKIGGLKVSKQKGLLRKEIKLSPTTANQVFKLIKAWFSIAT